jgi:uncharacterized protein (DUF58 family)
MDGVLRADFCPWANRWVYWIKDPFWCLLMAVGLSAAVGIFVNPMVLLFSVVLGVLGILAALLPWLTMRGLECSLSLEQNRGRVGEVLGIRLRIRNRRIWPAWGVALTGGIPVGGSLSECGGTDAAGIALAKIPGRSEMEFVWRMRPSVHGSYPSGNPAMETGFPFGIFRARRFVDVKCRAIVWPATVAMNGLPDSPVLSGQEESMSDRSAGESGDLLGTRFFRSGDSLRRVHWAQTARQQQLVVSERQSVGGSLVSVFVDSRQESYVASVEGGIGSGFSWELAIRVAASVCESVYQQHGRVELELCGRRYETGESIQGFRQLMDALSTASPGTGDVGFGVAERRGMRGGVLFTISTPEGIRRGFAEAAGRGLVAERRICVSSGSENADSDLIPAGWRVIRDGRELGSQLPRLWKEFCNVR